MQSGSLIPDRQLTFSPELAATIGLEEAVLLQEIGGLLKGQAGWMTINLHDVQKNLPFWSTAYISDLIEKLTDLGILAQAPHPEPQMTMLAVANTMSGERAANPSPHPDPDPGPNQHHGYSLTTPWLPDRAIIDLLILNHGMSEAFIDEVRQNFIPDSAREIETQFRQYVLSQWRNRQSQYNTFKISAPSTFGKDWVPSQDALEVLAQAGIDAAFANSVRAEFVLYWSERGGAPKEINSRFVEHVRRRWLRHTSQIQHSTEPSRISRNWQPDLAVYDTLRLAGINEESARALLPEFIMYWLDSNEVHTSWNSKFLQHAKRQCRAATEGDQHGGEKGRSNTGAGYRSKDRSLNDDLTDTSWAN
ncbi:DnaT-like ssDNA-binding domain-containing protein [Luminiphilus sp.]|nr:DnaT-like ssDNA-binding domain-containing protein [Luminiphilus sp.]